MVIPDIIPLSTTTTHIEAVSALLNHIAYCESRNNPNAKNPTSTASGRFQFLRSSWNYYGYKLWGDDLINHNVFDWNDNTELANWVFKRNGTSDWLASKECWQNMVI